MRALGIVCEFNPLHNGHKRIIDEAKSLGADCVICVMSGNAVQRGEVAIIDKYRRAEAAIKAGADIVLELPFPWSAASAEYFCSAGVSVLSGLCDGIVFGSECGDISLIKKAAEAAASNDFREEYERRLHEGERAAGEYFTMLGKTIGAQLSSNDLLGIEYVKAAYRQGAEIDFYTLKRDGSAYNEVGLGDNDNPSATALRAAWKNGCRDTERYIPREAQAIFDEAIKNNELTDMDELSKAILMFFRLAEPQTLECCAEAEGGIANRICRAARESASLDEMFQKLRTKRYTDAKLRRAILFCMTGVNRENLCQTPEYVTLLGATDKGRKMLSELRKKENPINIVTKAADAPKDSAQFVLGERLEAIFTLATKSSAPIAESYTKKAFIL